ncbi:Uncharacterised protein [Mycobacteroides abscessus subsp. abscessus]|nr:Uncharacterised protein [Mycobacteroides abscessus subsp. abscessus]
MYKLNPPPIGITTLTFLSAKNCRTSVWFHHEIPSVPPPAPANRYSVGAGPSARITVLLTTASIDGEYTCTWSTRGASAITSITPAPGSAGAGEAPPDTLISTAAAISQPRTPFSTVSSLRARHRRPVSAPDGRGPQGRNPAVVRRPRTSPRRSAPC